MTTTIFNRMHAKFTAGLAIGLAAGWAGLASAEVPAAVSNMIPAGLVNYQGTLLTSDSVPLPYTNGIYDIEFRVYPSSSGGTNTAIWGAGYKVFVNNGVFGLMLGQSGGSALNDNPDEYLPNELWKALWYDEFSANNLDRFLGITVKQDQNGNDIASPAEAVPRQQFLATPYAARAQQAMYARRSSGDFAVGGNLTATNLTGNLTVGGTLTVTNLSGNLRMAGTLTAGTLAAGTLTVTTLAATNLTAGNVTVTGTNSGFGTIPIGGIILWSGSTVPAGWALCNGTVSNGITTPNLEGRFVVGANVGAGAVKTNYTGGFYTNVLSGGSATHALTLNEMPAHTHGYSDWSESEATTSNNDSGQDGDGMLREDLSRTTVSAGGSLAHNNLPPFYALAYIMRVK